MLGSSSAEVSLSCASLALSWGFHVLSPSAANGLACCAVGEITTGPSGELSISCVLAVAGMGECVRSVTGPAAVTSCGVSPPEILCHIAPGGGCCGVSAASNVRWVAVTGELPGLPGVVCRFLGWAFAGMVCGGPMLPIEVMVGGGRLVGGGGTGGWGGTVPWVGSGGMSGPCGGVLAGITLGWWLAGAGGGGGRAAPDVHPLPEFMPCMDPNCRLKDKIAVVKMCVYRGLG